MSFGTPPSRRGQYDHEGVRSGGSRVGGVGGRSRVGGGGVEARVGGGDGDVEARVRLGVVMTTGVLETSVVDVEGGGE